MDENPYKSPSATAERQTPGPGLWSQLVLVITLGGLGLWTASVIAYCIYAYFR